LLFNSYVFIAVFLPVTLAGFVLARRFGQRAALAFVTAASIVFYGWWSVVRRQDKWDSRGSLVAEALAHSG